jgi:hypothetical protein
MQSLTRQQRRRRDISSSMLEQQVRSDKAAMAAIYGTERGSALSNLCPPRKSQGGLGSSSQSSPSTARRQLGGRRSNSSRFGQLMVRCEVYRVVRLGTVGSTRVQLQAQGRSGNSRPSANTPGDIIPSIFPWDRRYKAVSWRVCQRPPTFSQGARSSCLLLTDDNRGSSSAHTTAGGTRAHRDVLALEVSSFAGGNW